MQRAEPVEPDDAVELVEHAGEPLGGADVVAAGQQVAGVQAGAEPLAAARAVDQRRELLERAPERPARARRCSRGAARSVSGLLQRLARSPRRRA